MHVAQIKSIAADSLPTLGAWIQSHAAELARAWRRASFVDGARRPTALLDGVVENLLVEIGRGLDRADEPSGEAWNRSAGLVRHVAPRGRAALATEFRRLAFLVDADARTAGASDLQRMRLRRHFVAAHAQAVIECDAGVGHGGHIVLEVFEATPHLPLHRHHAA